MLPWQAALPSGTEVVLFNNRRSFSADPTATASEIQEMMGPLNRLNLTFICGDPMSGDELESLALDTFNCIIILCDQSWMDPDRDQSNGIDTQCTGDMLRLDSLIMGVHVNVRMLLHTHGAKNCKIITEKVSFEGMTHFEDPLKLPLGVSVNRKDYIAKLLSYASYTPKILPIVASMAQTANIELRDPAMFVDSGENINYWGLMERVEGMSELLLGWVELPPNSKKEMRVVLNPEGAEERSLKRAWSSRTVKLITISSRRRAKSAELRAQEKRQRPPPPKLPTFTIFSQPDDGHLQPGARPKSLKADIRLAQTLATRKRRLDGGQQQREVESCDQQGAI
mmetsp:Transcript_40088/g.113563  ORF Transcript_40088/g.113563 Transcript_40088/m.113563 type:complete len:339 (-) Transcript_40088:39-1055(-)